MKLLITLALLTFTSSLLGQDLSETASFGEIEISAGFSPDPYAIELTAGGSTSASSLGGSCTGYIANAPDLQVDYENGFLPLMISVGSESDTTLVVNLPDGSWLCDDDGGEGLNPLLELSNADSGVYDIWVGTIDEDSYPSAVLYISELEAQFASTINSTNGSSGQFSNASYGSADLPGGFTPDPYSIEVAAGGSIDASTYSSTCSGYIATDPDFNLNYESGFLPLIFSVGSESDTTLAINLPDGSWLCDDDGGEGLNPMLEISDAETGVYNIWVGTFDEDTNPSAVLSISELGGYYASSIGNEGEASSANIAGLAGEIYSGSLESTDDVQDSGAYSDTYVFDASRGDEAIIDLRSESFDSMLMLISPSGAVITNDDYEGDTSRSLITETLDETGIYAVIVTSFYEQETGSYTLGIDSGASLSGPINFAVEGSLETSDLQTEDGEYLDYYEFTGTPGQNIVIDLRSDTFDTLLVLESPTSNLLENDDAESFNHSQIETQLSESGTYIVYVTSYGSDVTGDYSLTINGSSAAGGNQNSSRDTQRMALDQRIGGSLANGDSLGEEDKYTDFYSFTGTEGQNIHFEVSSSSFDTYLTIIDPNGNEYANDDFDGSTSMSVVDLTLPASGRYSVIVTSYRAEETGEYNVLATTGSGSSNSGNFISRASGSSTGAQTYGIFVGISDYSQLRETNPGWGDLSYTDEDAIVVRDSLIEHAGMNPANAITLIDRQATSTNIIEAFNTIAAQADEDDTFVFFYSGHGGQELRSGGFTSTDADGYDETLALSDRTVTDDEINELFNTINAKSSVIILDSCYSGGFAKDIVSRPGRMGLFSSDEDVPSLVASKFQAGGYLSYFFADAVNGGNADLDGDNAINAMEISQYIHERYSSESQSKGPSNFDTPDFGYQHLVADRGGVAHDQVLFIVR